MQRERVTSSVRGSTGEMCAIARGHAYSDEYRLPAMEEEGGVVMMSVDGVEGMWGVGKLGKIRNIDGL